jgi:hypothetical protein
LLPLILGQHATVTSRHDLPPSTTLSNAYSEARGRRGKKIPPAINVDAEFGSAFRNGAHGEQAGRALFLKADYLLVAA